MLRLALPLCFVVVFLSIVRFKYYILFKKLRNAFSLYFPITCKFCVVGLMAVEDANSKLYDLVTLDYKNCY